MRAAPVFAPNRPRLAAMFGVVLLLHAAGWGVLMVGVAPQSIRVGSTEVFGAGIGVTAYLLGMRHAFDADHIAAIDATTRKLMSQGERPLSVGFWFSLGHSSIVFALCAVLAAGAGAASLSGWLGEGPSSARAILGIVGTSVSGIFLYIIGILNLVILLRLVADLRLMRHGQAKHLSADGSAVAGGPMTRILSRTVLGITRPWQMYVVGLLFGLGFDTATEVSLLIVAGGAATLALPWYSILSLPALFAAGMTLMDTIDGCFMNAAYGWALSHPRRKVSYNLVVTGLSVAVTLVIGSIELGSIAIGLRDLGGLGYAIVGLFVLAWLIAVCAWRFGRVGENGSAPDGDGGNGRISGTVMTHVRKAGSEVTRGRGSVPGG